MTLAAMIIGIIGGLSALSLATFGYFVGSLFVTAGAKDFATGLQLAAVITPILVFSGSGLVRLNSVVGGLLLIASAGVVLGLLGVNFLSLGTVILLGVAGTLGLLAEGVRTPDGVVNAGAFWFFSILLGVGTLMVTRMFLTNEYFFFAAYVVLQYIVLSTAWNILGGYTGYTNFGVAAFFAFGAYCSVVLHKLTSLPIPVMILFGGVISGVMGFGMGYLTLRLKGVFFAIATLALAIVAQTLIVNWDFVGGSRGIYVIRPAQAPLGGSYIQYLYTLMMVLCVISVGIARTIERSRLGLGFNAIRDDEQAAEAAGVPTLRLKLISTTLSGALMGMAGAPLPYYVTYLDPASSFNLSYAVNSVAMPLIGGMTSWVGPVVGAILLGTIQQLATVTISSALNLLIVGVLLIVFVVVAPNGIVGLVQSRRRARLRR
jgi:branched-chain amino acid transport system permease protein